MAAGQPWGLHSIVLFEMPRKRLSSLPYRPELLNQSFLDLRFQVGICTLYPSEGNLGHLGDIRPSVA